MRRVTDYLYQKASPKAIAITAAASAVVAVTNFSLYFTLFLPLTGGTAYMELNLGYLPSDLFRFAESYGEEGRRMYIAMSSTLDMLTPFFGALLMLLAALYLARKRGKPSYCPYAFALSSLLCLSDWAENACMIALLSSYPEKVMAAAFLARAFTTLKYILMLVLIVLLLMIAKGRKKA